MRLPHCPNEYCHRNGFSTNDLSKLPGSVFKCGKCDIQYHTHIGAKNHMKEKHTNCDVDMQKIEENKYCDEDPQIIEEKQKESVQKYLLAATTRKSERIRRPSQKVRVAQPKKGPVCQHCKTEFSTRSLLLNHINEEYRKTETFVMTKKFLAEKFAKCEECSYKYCMRNGASKASLRLDLGEGLNLIFDQNGLK